MTSRLREDDEEGLSETWDIEDDENESYAGQKEDSVPKETIQQDDDNHNYDETTKNDTRFSSSASSSQKSNNCEKEKCVRFSTITIQEYPIIVGDHPDVSAGTPITIGWEVISTYVCHIDKYELQQDKEVVTKHDDIEGFSTTRRRRRMGANIFKSPSICLGAMRRESLLTNLGFTELERREGRKSADKIRNQRRLTGRYMCLSKMYETILDQSSSGLFGGSGGTGGGKRKKHERHPKKISGTSPQQQPV